MIEHTRKLIHRRPSRGAKVAALATLTLGTAIAALSLTVSPASAACASKWAYTDGNNPNTWFAISSNSTCNDMNFERATVSQTYRGYYYTSAGWKGGSAGWISRGPSTYNWRVAISNVSSGTAVKVVGCCTNAQQLVFH
jgi:hypothetical protein